MIFTEKEAHEKWCPHSRIARVESWNTHVGNPSKGVIGGVNRDALGGASSPPYTTRCLGSACMAWRRVDETRGYCGLSGAPGPHDIKEQRKLSALEREHAAIKKEQGESHE